jgi:hypothetical protein
VQEDISRQIRLADLAPGEDGTVGASVNILANDRMCLPPGEYRAEFFLDGRSLAVPAQEPIRIGSFEAYRSRELDVAFCYPAPSDKACAGVGCLRLWETALPPVVPCPVTLIG